MLWGSDTIGITPFGLSGYSAGATPSDYELLLDSDEENRRWLIKAYPLDSGGSPSVQYWTQNDDVSLTNPYERRTGRCLYFESSIFAGRLELSGISRPDFGSLVVENRVDDGTSLTDLRWPGAIVDVFIGDKSWAESRYVQIQKSKVDRVSWKNSNMTLRLTDVGLDLSEFLQGETYSGAGGSNGSLDLEGVRKPFCYGPVDGVTLRLVDSSYDLYQTHDRSISAVRAVYDGGVELTSLGDMPGGILTIEEWDPVPGYFITDLANGLIRLGAKPFLTITADIDGDDNGTGDFAQTAADIIKRILLQRTDRTAADIDIGAFYLHSQQRAEQRGIYSINGTETLESVINQLCLPASFFRFDRLGIATIGDLYLGGSNITIDETNTLSIQSIDDSPEIVRSVKLGCHRAWTILTDSQLVADATDDYRDFVKQEFRVAEASDPAIEAAWGNTVELIVQTLLYNEAATQGRAEFLLSFLSRDARLWLVKATHVQLKAYPGITLTLKNPDYARLSAGTSAYVLSVKENSATNMTELILYA